jgi:UDP-3-O-acyl N-acetylglucosamine deacetylase
MSQPLQTTLATPITLGGRGIHSGMDCDIAIHPAEADSGVVFVRVDLEGAPVIPARIENVTQETMLRQTVLHCPEKPQVTVRTVEHILASLHGMGVDNARVEMSAAEPPIWDGSAKPLADKIAETGTREIPGAFRRCFRIDRPVAWQPGDTSKVEFAAWPSEFLTVTYFLYYDHPVIGSRAVSFRVDPKTFQKEIAPARTFCTFEEVEFLRSKNLIQGGDENNAVIVGQEGILNTKLLWEDELARHKLLDLLGDLLLLGAPVRGHVLSFRGGHQSNAKFIQHLRKEFQIQ